jgi:hypothetical protein
MAIRVTLTIQLDTTLAELAQVISDAEGEELTADDLASDVVIGSWWMGHLDGLNPKIVDDDIYEEV